MRSDATDRQIELLPEEPSQTVHISGAWSLRVQHGEFVVQVHGVPAFRFRSGDEMHARLIAVQLYEQGHASAVELERLAGCDKRSLFRARRAWLNKGAAGLVRAKTGPKGPRLGEEREHAISRLHARGVSANEIWAPPVDQFAQCSPCDAADGAAERRTASRSSAGRTPNRRGAR